MTDSQKLLADYVANGSEPAFRELVTRYLDLVHSTAVRLVGGDAHLAQDVAQTVFADLARKAATLPADVMLGGWLHRDTCFVAGKTMRTERRRQFRERQAVAMNSPHDHTEANLAQIAPVLDDAINQLGPDDRTAILLRFFERRDFRSVGENLGTSENAAQKRVARALEELRVLLKHRGVVLSGTALTSVLAVKAVSAAPAGLAAGISGAVLGAAAAGNAGTAGVLKLMAVTKLKYAAVTALVVAGLAAPWMVQNHAQARLSVEAQIYFQRSNELVLMTVENQRLTGLAAQRDNPRTAPNGTASELARLRGEVGRLRTETQRLAQLNEARTAANQRMSNLIARIRPDTVIKSFSRTNVFYVSELRDVGTETLDAAVETTLKAMTSHDQPAFARLATGGRAAATSDPAFDKLADELQGLSEIDLTREYDRLDGSVQMSCGLVYAADTGTLAARSTKNLQLYLRPSSPGWRCDSFSTSGMAARQPARNPI